MWALKMLTSIIILWESCDSWVLQVKCSGFITVEIIASSSCFSQEWCLFPADTHEREEGWVQLSMVPDAGMSPSQHTTSALDSTWGVSLVWAQQIMQVCVYWCKIWQDCKLVLQFRLENWLNACDLLRFFPWKQLRLLLLLSRPYCKLRVSSNVSVCAWVCMQTFTFISAKEMFV